MKKHWTPRSRGCPGLSELALDMSEEARGPLSSWEGVLKSSERMCEGEVGRNRHGRPQSWREQVTPTVRPLCPRGDLIPKDATAQVGEDMPDPAGPAGSRGRSNADKRQGPTVEKPAPAVPLLPGIYQQGGSSFLLLGVSCPQEKAQELEPDREDTGSH